MKKLVFLAIAYLIAVCANAREPQRGYRGFVDWDNTIGKLGYSDGDMDMLGTQWLTGVTTTHGYQINNHAFVGLGLGMTISSEFSNVGIVPLFADFRYDTTFGKYTPFGDIRLGYNACNGGGIYFSPTVGYRLNWGRKANFNFGIGLTLRGMSFGRYDITVNPIPGTDDYYYDCVYLGKQHRVGKLFTIRLGIDF